MMVLFRLKLFIKLCQRLDSLVVTGEIKVPVGYNLSKYCLESVFPYFSDFKRFIISIFTLNLSPL